MIDRLFTATSMPVSISFAQPMWLALIPVLSGVTWWIARRSLAAASLTRRVLVFSLRSMVLAMLCIALAEPSIERRATSVAVVAVRDVSDSVPADQQRRADEFLAASARLKSPSDSFGLVSTAREAFVQTLPSRGGASLGVSYVGDTGATDLEHAIRLGAALFPADSGGRELLITDANQTRGSFIDAAREMRAAGIPIDVACVDYDRSAGVRLTSLSVPAWTRAGDAVDARMLVESGRECTARLSVLLDSQPVDLDPDFPSLSTTVRLKRGSNLFTVPLRLGAAPVHQVDAVVEPIASPDDHPGLAPEVPDLLRATAVTFSSTHGRVLVLSDDEAASRPFVEALASRDVMIEVRSSERMPSDDAELAGYDAVVLFDQPAFNYSLAQQESLARYARDAGGGLLVIGGPHALGAGGWIGSPLADALPVLLDPPSKRDLPKGALALVIDCSGSMGQPVGKSGATQQQIANEAAIAAVRSLTRLDDVCVVSFNSAASTVVPLTRCANSAEIERTIRGIGSGGGTYMFPGVEAAAAELAKSDAGVKHIVVLTDGQTTGDPSQAIGLAANLKQHGVTLSAVVIGNVPNEDLLMRLAGAAGGRCYRVDGQTSQTVLPQIFIKEADLVRRALIHEGPAFRPALAFHADSLAGIAAPLPAMTGYVVTAEREGLAIAPIRGPENDPILAQWQHGLGRVTVFTSDATGRWDRAWTGWDAYGAFWKQQLAWTMRPPGDQYSRVSVAAEGDTSRVSVELFDAAGDPLSFATLRGRLSGVDGEVDFRQTGPGRYEASVAAEGAGVHLLAIEYAGPDGKRGSLRAAIVKRAGEELREPTPARDLLMQAAALTGGRVYTLNPGGADLWIREHVKFPVSSKPVWLIAAMAGVGLFLMDVAARRISIDLMRVRARVLGLLVAAPHVQSGTLRSLVVAKERAAGKMERRVERAAEPEKAPATESAAAAQKGDPAAPGREAAKPVSGDDPMSRLHAAKRRASGR